MKTLMRNGRDRRSDNPQRATRGKNACFCLGPISGSHQGPQPQRLHLEAGYMAAPERFAQPPDSPLAPRAPSIHGTYATCLGEARRSACGGKPDIARGDGDRRSTFEDKRISCGATKIPRQTRPKCCGAAVYLTPCD